MKPSLWLIFFVVLQAADGLLTYLAVERFGVGAEGNPILAAWILLTGSGPALVCAKLLACACGGVLYAAGGYHVLAGLSALYLVVAIMPWLSVFAIS
jgi:hypothetical protein